MSRIDEAVTLLDGDCGNGSKRDSVTITRRWRARSIGSTGPVGPTSPVCASVCGTPKASVRDRSRSSRIPAPQTPSRIGTIFRPIPGFEEPRARIVPRSLLLLLVAVALVVSAGCRQDMFNQPRVKPLAQSDLFDDGKAARDPVPGTVARGQLHESRELYRGIGQDGRFVAVLPVPLNRDLLQRGRERYEIFCSPCHARTGDGRGMIVRRGFKQPSSFHVERLRAERIGYFFDVMTNGFGQMSSYSAQVPVADRWAIAAYVRALQLSQHAMVADLTDGDRTALASSAQARDAGRGRTDAGEGGHGGTEGGEGGRAEGTHASPRQEPE